MFKKKNKDLKQLKKEKQKQNKELNYKLYMQYLTGEKRLKDLSILKRFKMRIKLLRFIKKLGKMRYSTELLQQIDYITNNEKKLIGDFYASKEKQ